jgi:hypothetical protein
MGLGGTGFDGMGKKASDGNHESQQKRQVKGLILKQAERLPAPALETDCKEVDQKHRL